jgi:hypothetical protein
VSGKGTPEDLEPHAGGHWGTWQNGGLRGIEELQGAGLCVPRGARPNPDPDPRQAEQRHGRGSEGADGAHPLDASLRQRERPALWQLHVSRSQPAWSV